MKDFKDEIQNELDRIISEQKELAKKETEKLLSDSRKEIKDKVENDVNPIGNFQPKSKSKFFRKLIMTLIGFLAIALLIFAYYKLDYFKDWRSKEEPTDVIVIEDTNEKLDSLNNELAKLNSNKDCYNSLLTAELGGKKVTLPCGSSSGKKGAGKRTEVWLETIENINIQIDSLKIKINAEIKKEK